jgi:hypothetical protein
MEGMGGGRRGEKNPRSVRGVSSACFFLPRPFFFFFFSRKDFFFFFFRKRAWHASQSCSEKQFSSSSFSSLFLALQTGAVIKKRMKPSGCFFLRNQQARFLHPPPLLTLFFPLFNLAYI